ncbi:MAG: RraA family protein, partial [Actinobacteria bacterium]|nr:RraA family protein [Actinomycetota bacterium]
MKDLITRLRSLDTCAVSDAMDRLGHPGHAVHELRPLAADGIVAGAAVTVLLGPPTAGVAGPRR